MYLLSDSRPRASRGQTDLTSGASSSFFQSRIQNQELIAKPDSLSATDLQTQPNAAKPCRPRAPTRRSLDFCNRLSKFKNPHCKKRSLWLVAGVSQATGS